MVKRGRQRRVDHDRVRQLAMLGWTDAAIAADVGCSAVYARLIRRGVTGGSQVQTRLTARPVFGRSSPGMPPIDHPAVMGARTIFPTTVVEPGSEPLLKSAHNSAKIGRLITKGRWKGFEVYTLTLEERATCPQSCRHWRSCYGNNMQMAHRFRHGEQLEEKIVREVFALKRRHPNGFAVRLHMLGDFYSFRYVKMWELLLDRVPQLHCFGFSARWDCKSDPIAKALVDLVMQRWDRFAIRFSNAPVDECASVSIEHPFQKPADAIICPQQVGKTNSCSTCALCWQSRRRIAFIQH